MMFGAGDERPRAAGGQHFYPVERYGVKLISMERKSKYLIIKRDRLESFLLETHSGYRDGEVQEAAGRQPCLANNAT
jgi:hypothetical protein